MITCANARCGKEFKQRRKGNIYCCEKCNDQASNDKHNEMRKQARKIAKENASHEIYAQDSSIAEIYNRALRMKW